MAPGLLVEALANVCSLIIQWARWKHSASPVLSPINEGQSGSPLRTWTCYDFMIDVPSDWAGFPEVEFR